MSYPYTARRRPVRRARMGGGQIAGALLAFAVLAVIAAWVNGCVTNRARRDCAARGGYFTQIVTSRHTGWSCTVPPRIGGADR